MICDLNDSRQISIFGNFITSMVHLNPLVINTSLHRLFDIGVENDGVGRIYTIFYLNWWANQLSQGRTFNECVGKLYGKFTEAPEDSQSMLAAPIYIGESINAMLVSGVSIQSIWVVGMYALTEYEAFKTGAIIDDAFFTHIADLMSTQDIYEFRIDEANFIYETMDNCCFLPAPIQMAETILNLFYLNNDNLAGFDYQDRRDELEGFDTTTGIEKPHTNRIVYN